MASGFWALFVTAFMNSAVTCGGRGFGVEFVEIVHPSSRRWRNTAEAYKSVKSSVAAFRDEASVGGT